MNINKEIHQVLHNATVHAGHLLPREQICRKGAGGPAGQTEQQSAVCPCDKSTATFPVVPV